MSSEIQAAAMHSPGIHRLDGTLFEVLPYLLAVCSSVLLYLFGLLTLSAAFVLTAIALIYLTVLAWVRFDSGRHPCFLFLSTFLLFQGGRLLAYCLGAQGDPIRIRTMIENPYSLNRDQAALVLLLVVLAPVCVYVPCRWAFRTIPPPDISDGQKFLKYLYLVFFSLLPLQFYKNFAYMIYARQHGGYAFLWVNHDELAAAVPWIARVAPLLAGLAFIALFVFERRRKVVCVIVLLYFLSSIFLVILGSRMYTFGQIVTLWYIARMESTKRPSILRLGMAVLALVVLANVIYLTRSEGQSDSNIGILSFIEQQGASIDVTSVAVSSTQLFKSHALSYLSHELLAAFHASGANNYQFGNQFDADVSNFLNADAYRWGYGLGGAYLGEAYVVGGIAGVILISTLIGYGLRLLYLASGNAFGLVATALLFPDVLLMPRGSLLGWVSVAVRSAMSIAILVVGWRFYNFFVESFRTQRAFANGSSSPQ